MIFDTKINNIFVSSNYNLMSIITLTTDFGLKDPWVGAVKGQILTELPHAVIVDISHEVSPFDIGEAAFILKNAYKNFPKGSIHIIGVDTLINPYKKPIAVSIDEHFFICSDNGILSLIAQDINPQEVVEINITQTHQDTVFPTLDIFAPVACHLARGGALSMVGNKVKEIRELSLLKPVVKEGRVIIGTVIYIDNYGNSITNISRKLFDQIGKKRTTNIRFRNHEFTVVYKNYDQFVKNFEDLSGSVGKGLALFGSSNYLEIAVYRSNPESSGSASTLYGLCKGSEITVEFT